MAGNVDRFLNNPILVHAFVNLEQAGLPGNKDLVCFKFNYILGIHVFSATMRKLGRGALMSCSGRRLDTLRDSLRKLTG